MSAAPPVLDTTRAQRAVALAAVVSVALAAVKITTGVAGSSYALIADGIESIADSASSLLVLAALWYSTRPPDKNHPYGHGKAESLAAVVVAGALLAAAATIAWQALHEIRDPHGAPEWFTLPVLVGVVVVKIFLFRQLARIGGEHRSTAMQSDAWHHASDAITSVAAFIGISVALFAGEGWETADDWAALAACSIIVFNGLRLLRTGVNELMDGAVSTAEKDDLRTIAANVEGVRAIEKMRVRKSGTACLMDIHVEVDADATVEAGHDIARAVKFALLDSPHRVIDVIVHIEPWHPDEEERPLSAPPRQSEGAASAPPEQP
ncbi:MAG: hypothetical protein PWP23_1383 [Candidatus Sumerlaeota bacterium]|nr:hypothetical protein [Candidatus Sumerlaeota bacterium]